MVRAAPKTCPNLHRVIEGAPPELVAAFLNAKVFERFDWLEPYKVEVQGDGAETVGAARSMLTTENKARLKSLETEAARVVMMAADRGQFALTGLAETKLDAEIRRVLLGQRDALARSLYAYGRQRRIFDAAENALHLRLYRRYDRHYQTFPVEPSSMGGPDAESDSVAAFVKEVGASLDRGEGYKIERFDIPEDGDEPAAEMYLLFHPDLPRSVRELSDQGEISQFYYQPPGEAMIVHVPSTGRLHVRAGTRTLRHLIAERFVATALEQPVSREPVDFHAYDLSRFLSGFDLETPEVAEATILEAAVIRADVSILNLATRLSLSAPLDRGIRPMMDHYQALGTIVSGAIAVRFIEIGVRYHRSGRSEERTLTFTLSDRNTSSLMSLDDPFERVLGHRLLRAWKILRDGRAPSASESLAAMPALLALWDERREFVDGKWLRSRGVDVGLLLEVGFLVPAGYEGDDLIDDEDSVGQVPAEIVVRPEGAELNVTEGQSAPGEHPDAYRRYRVRDGWVEDHLRGKVASGVDVPALERINPHLYALGNLTIDDRNVPVWLARGLDDERIRAQIDTDLRARSDRGIGLVLDAGRSFGSCLAANVLCPLADHLAGAADMLAIDREGLATVFRRNRGLARGGMTVTLELSGENAGTLFVPGKGSIGIVGANRLIVLSRLVNAHNSGKGPMKTEDLTAGFGHQSLANIFGQPLWPKLQTDFVRSKKKGQHEIAV